MSTLGNISEALYVFISSEANKSGSKRIELMEFYRRYDISNDIAFQALKELKKDNKITYCYKPVVSPLVEVQFSDGEDIFIDIYCVNLA